MLKKTLVAISVAVICSTGISSSFAAQQDEFKFINRLKYHKTMYEAVPSIQLMKMKMGANPEDVGGHNQDLSSSTGGLPMTFRPTNNSDEVWILDTINGALKLFKSSKLIKSVNIKSLGVVQDFAIRNNKFAFLNSNTGKIYITDYDGKVTNTISGFESANSIEFASDKILLITSPLSGGVVRLSTEGALLGLYDADQSLSNFSSEKGVWGLECFGGTVAKLYVRTEGTNSTKVVAEFPFSAYKDVEYKGGNIYGFDSEGNIYFGLTACDSNGVIYRDRIYKCNQDGKVLKELDVIDDPILSPELPRHRIACPDGRIMTFACDEIEYSIKTYSFK